MKNATSTETAKKKRVRWLMKSGRNRWVTTHTYTRAEARQFYSVVIRPATANDIREFAR